MGLIGYARISTAEGAQLLDRQLDALNRGGCERIFEDRASGTNADRPGLAACLDFLRKGDVLVVLDLDRLGRLAGELITLIDQLAARGIAFRALNAPMCGFRKVPDSNYGKSRTRISVSPGQGFH
jgi:DNA invertase Pin-like site-specific DNA recombinase